MLFKLLLLADETKQYGCGDSLINSKYVVTAGHCVNFRTAEIILICVRLGELDTSTDIGCDNMTTFETVCAPAALNIAIEQIIFHEKYNPLQNNKRNNNDIALLRLEKEVTFTEFISLICLPLKGSLSADDLAGVNLTVAGWGATETFKTSDKKLKVILNVWSHDECSKKYVDRNIISQ